MLNVIRQLLSRINHHQTSLVAAGCAFYGTLALFPALSMIVSIYGLVFNPRSAEAQLALMKDLLPAEAWHLIAGQIDHLVHQHQGTLGLSLAAGLLATFWSASAGTKAMLSALNLAEGARETRSLLRFQATGLALTLGTMLAAVIAVALLVALPAAVAFVGLSRHATLLIHIASFAVLVGFVGTLIATLYRVGPVRAPPRILPGVAAGTLLWLGASWLFADLTESVFRLGATYGPLATAAAMMLWFWVSAYATLFGAELNAVLVSGSARSAGSKDPPPVAVACARPDTPAAPPPPPPSSPAPS